MGYYLALKRNECITTRVNLQEITLSEKKSIPKDYILYNFTYVTYLKWYSFRNVEENSSCQGLGTWEEEWKGSGCGYNRIIWGVHVVMDLFCILPVVATIQTYTCDKMVQSQIYIHAYTQINTSKTEKYE